MNHPIIIGIGQITYRKKIAGDIPSAIDLAQMAIEDSVKDTGCTDMLELADSISLINMFSDVGDHQVERLCDKMGIRPAVRENTAIGGNTPQWLVNRAADKIMNGDCKIAILAGAETFYRQNKSGPFISIESLEGRVMSLAHESLVVGNTRNGTTPYEQSYGMTLAHRIYPFFENALRYHLKMSLKEHRAYLKKYFDAMAEIASGNPYAWFSEGHVKEDITIASASNPFFNYPYTKYMNPNPAVNQGAAVIMTDTDTARKLSISRDRWIYLHGGAEASDKWHVSERVNYHSSPAIRLIVESALLQSGRTLADISFFDLYSCFPCAALIAAQEIGLSLLDLPPLSITGGLSCFGGPGNNYTMHAIANAVDRLRKQPDEYGLVSGMGWFLTKHAVGIYSGVEPANEWRRTSQNEIQSRIDALESPVFCETPQGNATVETYTVMHESSEATPFPIIIARLDSGERCFAATEKGSELALHMEQEEFIGRRGMVTSGGNGPNIFSLEG